MGDVAERLVVVLVRARNPLNIGAAARAMTDFGVTDLRVVSEYAIPFQTAASAVDAAPVLESAQYCTDVQTAVADCSLVYGTTALGARRLEHPVDLLAQAAERIQAQTAERLPAQAAERTQAAAVDGGSLPAGTGAAKIALLFGSEKTGLSNSELSFCHRLLTIPMHRTGVSMNLGQAVAVCLYELVGRGAAAPRALPEPEPAATADDLLRMEDLLRQVLEASGYAQRHPGNMVDANLRRLLRRVEMRGVDFPVWMGVLRQVLWKLQARS